MKKSASTVMVEERKAKKFRDAILKAMDDYSKGSYRVECDKVERYYSAKVFTTNHIDPRRDEPLFEMGLCINGQIMSVSGIIFPWLLRNIQLSIYEDYKPY